ncbi:MULTISPECIES: adenosylcobinamide-GDP ribazoletransferase [unclassified Streptomyces]|uniref:adenosylcobinamide-GDP ribazoletransferase n=1 Tax=unclassified Streptomyces TaxID=2593676 RepID=UPI001CB6BE46|nr:MULTISPECIES: adenosylcobinamide-GDP ribazoletransferase [unclassified Streptomyces]MBD0707334.1 cobalamin 5'-phosphate synthase [Streptomyces sp. CBMA291]MBD0717526.1 cobalamin 5'-phosphate synthase [Streptomyces sp. CBMA370]
MDGLRFAFGTLTVFPARITRWDRDAARAGMLCAPLAGLAIGVCAAVFGSVFLLLGAGPLLAAVLTTAVPAALTRGLHLDGLADTADGLGSAKPAEDALRIMKQSDIGPFGVIVLVLVLLAQVAALYQLYGESWTRGAAGAVLAAAVSRLALTHASRHGVPPARPEGLGAIVASTVPVRSATLSTALILILCAATGLLFSPYEAVHQVLAAGAAMGASALLLRRCIRRFGGVTGDVFGAVAETTATVALLALTLG